MKKSRVLLLIILTVSLSMLLSGCMYFLPTDKSIYTPDLVGSEQVVLPTANVITGDLLLMDDLDTATIVNDIDKTETVECEILGVIDTINVDVGEYVEKGQLVAVLDTEDIEQSIFVQEIALEKAKMVYDHQNVMYKTGKIDFYSLEFARLSLEATENYLSDLYEEQEFHYLYAPISGTVVDILKFSGESAKGDVLSICDKSDYLILCPIGDIEEGVVNISRTLLATKSGKENDLGKFVVIYDGEQYPVYIYRNYIEYSLTYDYYGEDSYDQAAFYELPDNITLGKKATLRYVEEIATDVLILPVSTVYKNDDGSLYTYVVVDNEREYRPVEVGITDGVFYEITSGLVKGEKVMKSR